MQLHLIAVGTRMPRWVEEGYTEYAKRLPVQFRLRLTEVPAGRRTKGADLNRLLREEGERVLAAIPTRSRVIALERTGRALSTRELAAVLESQLSRGSDVALLVGGPEGLSPACLTRADEAWSLSALTLAHPVVRVVVAEQLYRAWSIIAGTPYHR